MKGLGYLERISLAARWFLPRKEAENVIDDYRDILSEAGGAEAARERFGAPLKVVLSVLDRRKALAWNFFFAAALVFHFMFIYWAKNGGYYNTLILSAVTAALLLWVFGVEKLRDPFRGLPKHLLILSIALALVIIAMFVPTCFISGSLNFFSRPENWHYAELFYSFIYGCMIFFLLLSLAGIVLARLKDRRWRSVSILSLTAVCVVFYYISIFGNMDPIYDPSTAALNNYEVVFVTVAGIFAAGVGLC